MVLRMVGSAFLAVSLSLTAIASFADEKIQASELLTSLEPRKQAMSVPPYGSHKSDIVKWQPWSKSIFERAKKENKLVILDLEAIWCHWCHVMDKETYANEQVAKVLNEKYLAIKVDQDSRPDLSNRYEDYGWPATIIFDSNGKELVKRSGYINPDKMLVLLNKLAIDPKPEVKEEKEAVAKPSVSGTLSKELEADLESRHLDTYDTKNGGWGFNQKFLDWDSVEYCLSEVLNNNDKQKSQAATVRAKQTLNAQLALMDPVWGGVYQYSTDGDWKHPHFEKIMTMQAENMKVYAQASMLFPNKTYLQTSKNIAAYLRNFLTSPEGAFYTSQDADLVKGQHSESYFKLTDGQRRKLGMPNVDKHIYARENGWAINALAYLYAASGDKQYLDMSIKAANWIVANRAVGQGGFSHDQDLVGQMQLNSVLGQEQKVAYLGDTLAMGRAFLTLYGVTGDRDWLTKASQAADFINANFKSSKDNLGYVTSFEKGDSSAVALEPVRMIDENVMLARFANLLYRYTGKKEYEQMAKSSLAYLTQPQVATKRKSLVAGILLANSEVAREPLHITVVGSKTDKQAQELFAQAIRDPSPYKRIEWFDNKEGTLPNNEIEFPDLGKAAAFACSGDQCSSPAFTPSELKELVSKLDK